MARDRAPRRQASDPARRGRTPGARPGASWPQARAEATRSTERLSAAARERDAALAGAQAGARDALALTPLGPKAGERPRGGRRPRRREDGAGDRPRRPCAARSSQRTPAELANASADLTPLQDALAASREALAEARAERAASATRAETLAAELAVARGRRPGVGPASSRSATPTASSAGTTGAASWTAVQAGRPTGRRRLRARDRPAEPPRRRPPRPGRPWAVRRRRAGLAPVPTPVEAPTDAGAALAGPRGCPLRLRLPPGPPSSRAPAGCEAGIDPLPLPGYLRGPRGD